MRQVGLLRLGSLTLSGLLLDAPAALAADEELDGHWIGGFDNRNTIVVIEATFSGSPQLTGKVDLPQRGEAGIPLQNVTLRGKAMSFEVPGVDGNLLFEGKFDTPTRVVGSVRQGLGHTRFRPAEDRARVTADDMAGVYGTYEWAPGKVLLVAPGQEKPIYVDFESGRTGALFALGRDEFVAGPSVSTGFPVVTRLRVERDGVGSRPAHRLRATWATP